MGEHSQSIERIDSQGLKKRVLAKLLEVLKDADLETTATAGVREGPDAVIEARRGKERFTLLLEAKIKAEPRGALETIGRARLWENTRQRGYWVLGAPYVSNRTARICREGRVGYIDLAGNFDLRFGPVVLSSRTNVEIRQERKVQKTLFSPKASRLALAFLLHPKANRTQRALAGETKISLGLVNRTIREFERQRFVAKEADGWRLVERDALLAEWAKYYATRPRAGQRFLAQAALEDVEARLDRDAAERNYRYALTLESAAKYRAPFAPAMNLAFYCDAPAAQVAARLGVKPVEHGWNVEILMPPDDGVFYSMRRISVGGGRGGDAPGLGRNITNDIYLYLDLWRHPARGKEQAEHLLEVMAAEPRRRKRTTEEEVKFHEFLKLRDRANQKMREKNWLEAVDLFDRALGEIENLTDEQVETSRETERFHSWLTIEHLVRDVWDKDRKKRIELIDRLAKQIPDDEEVLRRFPPFRMNSSLVRFLLGTRRAIYAATGRGAQQGQEARVAVQHFKIATSPYTEGANETTPWVEEVRAWLRHVAKIDLVL